MSYPQSLREHLSQTVTTVCRCWRLTRRDGVVLGFTDHDMTLTVDGTTCMPQSGLSGSEVKQTLGFEVDAFDVEGALSSDAITEADISAGLLDGASVETFLVNWRNPADFALTGYALVGKITVKDSRFVAELESRLRLLDQPKGRFVLRACDAELGDERCKFALGSAYQGNGTVSDIHNRTTLGVAGLDAFETGLFSNGVLTWTSGRWSGQQFRIGNHVKRSDSVMLGLDMSPGLPEPGDAFSIIAGCDKSFASCRDRFANALNFRGFPHLPGNDDAYSYVSGNGNFDGGVIVP